MKNHLLFLFIIISLNGYSQIIYEKGYYIDSFDQIIECEIKNNDWKNNPTKIEYKLSKNAKEKTLVIESIKAFEIYNDSKHIRSKVNIDRSSENISSLSNTKNPKFKKEILLLKVLIEGKANLYYYRDENLQRFFYNIDNSTIEQLVYKKYVTLKNKVGKNNRFKQQLFNDLKCSSINIKDIEKIDYNKNDLLGLFKNYNECHNHEFIIFEKNTKQDLFNINTKFGISYSSLSTYNSLSSYKDTDFGSKTGFKFGIETEFILPYKNNKWAIILNPTYQSFISKKNIIINPDTYFEKIELVKANYKSIELPIGIRHYFFINNKSKIFINGLYVIDFTSNSIFDYSTEKDLDINPRHNIAFGVGFKHIDKFSFEFRYFTNRELTGNYFLYHSNYKSFSLMFGYTIL